MQIIENNRGILKIVILWLLIVAIMFGMTLLKLPLPIINVFFCGTTSFYFYKVWGKNSESNIEIIIIMFGFALRILVCLIDIYGTEILTIPFSGDDSMNFYNTSVAYYNGDFSRVYTKYPYVINAIYQIVGLNRFAAQYVNILCWSFCILLMQKSCELLKVEKALKIIAVALLSILPFHICISSILMRDMIVALSIMWTTYCLLKWMKSGNYIYLFASIIITLPALLMNNCVLAMFVVICLLASVYSPIKQKFCLEKKSVVILLGGVVSIVLIMTIPKFRDIIFTQIPNLNNGIFEAINRRLKSFYDNAGGSTYLLNEYVDSYSGLVFGTLQRIGYFLFSPVPWMWRGLTDIAGFLASASVSLAAMIAMIISFIYRKREVFRTLFFAVVFFVSVIFAWGVSNGGTALRHREKILSVMILLGVYSVQIIINARRERKNAQ